MQIMLIVASVMLFILTVSVPVIFAIEIINTIKWYHIILIVVIEFVLIIAVSAVTDEAAKINEPKAIDVYRGKTTLEITYVDSIPQDTVVIFKRKDKQ